jgi:hypothetical protein
VGDSFTEGMQVDYERTFCARLERALDGQFGGREVVCENYGVAGTGLFDYWHRITHDVLDPSPPNAVVLCVYPFNDFRGDFPEAGFELGGRPVREYFGVPSWPWHVVTWLNLKSRLGCYLQQKLFIAYQRWAVEPHLGPLGWWNDPAVAARMRDTPAVRRSRALLEAIREECARKGTRLCILVVGPAPGYGLRDGCSPLAEICDDWRIDVPVIDIAAEAAPHLGRLVFQADGHLNEAGHAYVAAAAALPLGAMLRGAAAVAEAE